MENIVNLNEKTTISTRGVPENLESLIFYLIIIIENYINKKFN